MKNIIFLFIFCLSIVNGFSQNCIPDAIVSSTQAQIDNFPSNYPNCTVIGGSMGVIGTVANLDSQVQIIEIGGNVLFSKSLDITDLSGLENLTKVEGFLKFNNTPGLSNVDGLGSLICIGVDLIVEDTSFANFDDLAIK